MRESADRPEAPATPTFIDVFAGCGGLSLGLKMAGWKGLFAVEKEPQAFSTLKHNLTGPTSQMSYDWPGWLPCKHITVSRLISKYSSNLRTLRGKVDLLAGGPPCQGFSFAGKRKKSDPRNHLFQDYLKLVEIIQPKYLLLENVKGITVGFKSKQKRRRPVAFSDRIKAGLEDLAYIVDAGLVKAVDFGVPQLRPRFILVAVRKEIVGQEEFVPLSELDGFRDEFLRAKGLSTSEPVTARQAISDLEVDGKKLVPCPESKGFQQIEYSRPWSIYQRLMRRGCDGQPTSLRLARHREDIRQRFAEILTTCEPGKSLSEKDRERFGLTKQCTVALDPDRPSHTLTTLPDDLLHYSEPRILCVREYARLQSFPDWYEFQGKYTTGGNRRKKECPRYTQVGNAVPPLLAEAIGAVLKSISRRKSQPLAKAACL